MRVNRLFLLIALSLLPLIGIFFTPDLLHTHDGLVHLPRIGAFYKALVDFHIPVRWAGDLNYGYGMPIFTFIYHLPYVIASVFVFLGLGLVGSFKISLALSYILSGVFMYLFAKEFFKDEKKAFLVAVFYQFAPFRFIELLLRGSFGEVYTYAFLPLVLYGLCLLFRKQSFWSFALTSVAAALLILSHNSISLVFFATAALFVLLFAKSRKQFLYGVLALGAGLLVASYYWIPAVMEHKYTFGNLYMRDLFRGHFAPLQNFFIPNITNSKALQFEGISLQLGLFHVTALLLSLFILFKTRKKLRKFDDMIRVLIFSLLICVFAFFFMQPISLFVWEKVDFLRQFQFPWRFLALTTFATSLMAVSFFTLPWIKNRMYAFLILLTVVTTVVYWIPQLGFDKIDERKYWDFPLTTTYYGETDVVWSAGPAKSYPKARVEVIDGEASVSDFKKKSQLHTFVVDAKSDAVLVDHTQYFPGWRVLVDNTPVPIQFQDPATRGEIQFTVPSGRHNVSVVFGESKIRFAADMITLGTLLFFGIGYIFRKRLFYEK